MEVIRLKYSEPFIRQAIRRYWWKHIGPVFPLMTVMLTVFLGYRVAHGDRSWVAGALGTVIILATAVMAASYLVHLRRSLKRLRRMKTPEATLELAEDYFRIASDVGLSEIKWSLISGIWRFETVWFLFFSAGEWMTLPAADIPPEAKAFIVSRASANGARIA